MLSVWNTTRRKLANGSFNRSDFRLTAWLLFDICIYSWISCSQGCMRFCGFWLTIFHLRIMMFNIAGLLKQSVPSRVINVSSVAHLYSPTLNPDDLNSLKEDYNQDTAYSKTKLCNVLFTSELVRKLEGTGAWWPIKCLSCTLHTLKCWC